MGETLKSAMRERPILFSGPMVRAVLERAGVPRGWFIMREEGGYFCDGHWTWNESRFQ